MSYLINKETLNDIKNNYNEYKNDELFKIKEILEEILKFCSKNRLIVYGGYALSKNINNRKNIIGSNYRSNQNNSKNNYQNNSKNNNHIYHINLITTEILEYEDIDVYSSNPAEDLNNLLKLIIKLPFVNSVVYKKAKHEGTYTLFVNYIKVMDMTFIDQSIINIINYNEIIEIINNKNYKIKIVVPFITFIDLLSVLESNDSLFRIDKTEIKLFNLQSNFPIKNNNESFNDININKFGIDFINTIINKFIEINNEINKINELKESENNIIDTNEYKSIKRAEIYKQAYKKINYKHDFIINGIYGLYLLFNYSNKKLNFPIEKIFELDIYVSTNLFFLKIEDYLNGLELSYTIEVKKGWNNFSQNYISIYIIDKEDSKQTFIINLYKLDKEKYCIRYNFKSSNNNKKEINIASLLFLKSHLLLKSNIYNKINYKIYNKCLFDLNVSMIKYNYNHKVGLSFNEQDLIKNYDSIKTFNKDEYNINNESNKDENSDNDEVKNKS